MDKSFQDMAALIKMFPEPAFGEKTADINHIGGIPAIIEKIAVRM